MGKSVLIVSHSNISVDNVVKQIANQFSDNGLSDIISQGKVLRYGYVRDEELSKNNNCVAFNYTLNKYLDLKNRYSKLSEESKKLKFEVQSSQNPEKSERRKEIEKQLKEIRARLKDETKILTSKAQVVATTVSKIYMDKLFDNKKYDVVMFDEVSMAYVPQLICAATFSKEKFICVGDFRQLAPIVQSENAKDVLQKDIFSFLNIARGKEIYNHPWLVMLNEQRRMHPQISGFSAKHIYKGLLKDHESVIENRREVVKTEPLHNVPMALIDLHGTFCAASKNADNSRFNIFSAIVSVAMALKSEKSQGNLNFKDEEKVGIITPYAAQTRLIRAIIQDYKQQNTTALSCATVHQFQGSERNTIIFDAVESYPFKRPGWLVSKNENSSVMRLINVALTRARAKFITVANTKFWGNKFYGTQHTYYSLLKHIESNNIVVDCKNNATVEFMKTLDFGKNIKPFFAAEDAFNLLIKDIKSAKEKLIFTLPTDILNTQYESALLDSIRSASQKGITVLGKAGETVDLNDSWADFFHKSKDAVFPLITIDDKITWYGFPITELYFDDKNFRYIAPKSPIFRITGKYINEMINSLCDLGNRVTDSGAKLKLTEKSNEKSATDLANYLSENEFCKECGATMELFRGRSGKYSLKCSKCGKYDYLTVNTTNDYLNTIDATCSVCGNKLYAGLSMKYGIYVKCSQGHFTKLLDI